jgi:glycosyltransferase involved in cell wall biosynthesis
MKIAVYVPSWPPGSAANGIVTYASQIIPELREAGHQVFVITPDYHSTQNDPFVVNLEEYERAAPLWVRARRKILTKSDWVDQLSRKLVLAVKDLKHRFDIDIIEIEETMGLSRAISSLRCLPVVVRLHGPWFITGRATADSSFTTADYRRECWEKCGIIAADFVTAPSLSVLQAVQSHYKVDLAQSAVLPNPMNAVAEAQRWKLETCDKNCMLFVGRFDRLKGGDLLIRAFRDLAIAHPQLRLTFVGPDVGIIGKDGQLTKFDGFVTSTLSPDAIARLSFKGRIPPSEVADLRKSHFMTVCASNFETFSYTVLEGMAHGCPIVATATGGIPELIQTNRNGLLFDPQDLSGLVGAAKLLLQDHPLAVRLGHQAWQDSRDKYGVEKYVKDLLVIYREAVKSFYGGFQ